MPFYPGHGVGLRNVGSYQISGHPFLTGSTLTAGEEKRVDFPFVTREFTVINSGSDVGPVLRVHFNSTSSGDVVPGHHFVTLDVDNQSMTFHTKCTTVFISCISVDTVGTDNGFELIANLTGIDSDNMYELTGAGLTD